MHVFVVVSLFAGLLGTVPQQARTITVPVRIEPRVVERLYNEAIIRDGSIDPLVGQLGALCADVARPKRSRANACLLRSHLEWRHGRMAPAMAAADEGLAVDPYDDMVFHKARLFDASGKMDETREWYQKALSLTTNPQLKETIRLRLTFTEVIAKDVQGLVALAKASPRDFRNRAAIALAILDFDKEAADLYQVFGEGTDRFRHHIRVAQWAIQAGDAPKAQTESWQAVQTATFDRDRNYGLSLLVEAHTLDKSLDKLLDRFAQQPTLSPEAQSVRIDLLRQTGQYDKAIELFKSANGQQLGPEMRRELLRMYRDAGQDAAMVAEYRRLISSEPALTDWVEGLSQYYLEQGDQQSARALWKDFLDRNTVVGTLLIGSDAMTDFGLHDLAVAATEKALANSPGIEDAAQVRLAQFELHRQRGANADAEAALAALDALLPAQSPFRTELADAYERIQKPQLAATTLERLSASKGGLSIDERMRLAWLFDSTGRRDDALLIWRELWNSESLAARRKLVEERLLMLAAELGTLGELAVDLEEKLANGTAVPRDVSLLVSIYTKVGDSVSAIEVVTSAAAQKGNAKTEVESLKEQAQIYLALAEYPDFTRVTRRLMEVDPDRKVDYLQSLLLNQIEAGADGVQDGQDGTVQLREWLGQLRKVGGDAVGAEFEAGVLEMAGFRDQALESYRRALAQHPERADDHLLLADLLRQAGRQAEAVTSLQYVTETAESDELFLVAIDGITNMRAGETTIKWAQRRALERLTSRDDKLYLYEMLAELAEETKDAKAYIATLETSLAHADSRRSHVLRELLAATAEVTTYEASLRLANPEAALNVAYARRLIALGEELPPDVYVDLGRTFIKMNDPAAARRAFDLAVDRTGRTSVVVDAAKLFERGGFDREAIREYERALVANSSDLETMVRLARLRERAGAVDTANELYLRALLGVLGRQNRKIEGSGPAPALETQVTFEYKRYYQILLSGVLATLPQATAPAGATVARLAPIEAAFDQELRQVAASETTTAPLGHFPRLAVYTQTLRALAYGAGVPAVSDRADAALRRQFSADPSVAAQAVQERERWGYSTPEAASANRPMDSADYMRDVGVALSAGDQDAALTAYRQWARFAGSPKPPIFLGTIELPDRSPGIPEVATHAWQRLDERHFGSLAQHIQGIIADDDTYAEKLVLDLIYQYEVPEVPILTRVEQVLGQPLIAEERLWRLVNQRKDWSLLNVAYVISRLAPDRQIDFIDRYAKASELNWLTLLKSWGIVLQKPMDAPRAARFMTVVKAALVGSLKRGSGSALLPNFMIYTFSAGIAPVNAPLVEEIEQFLAEKHPQVFKVGYWKASLLRDLGRDQEAIAAFVDAALQMYVPLPQPGTAIPQGAPSPYAYSGFVSAFAPFLLPKYRGELLALLEQKESAPAGLTEALISLRMELSRFDPTGDSRQLMAALQGLADRHPKNEQVRNLLHPLYDQWGNTNKAIEVLTELTRLKPDNREYRYKLISLWQKLDYPENVVKVAGAQTVDELAPPVVRNYYMESVTGAPTVRFPTLKRALDQIKALATGGDPKEAAMGLRTLLQTLPPAGMSINEFAQARDQADPYLYIRDFLMLDGEPHPKTADAPESSAPAVPVAAGGMVALRPAAPAGTPPTASRTLNTYDRLMKSLELTTAEVTPRAAKLTEVVGRSGFGIAELEAFLSNLRAADIDKQYVFINMLVDAYVSGGRADDELQRRSADAASGQMGQKNATVWLGLAARQPGARAKDLLQTAEAGGLLSRAQSALSQMFLARLYAAAGQPDNALKTYIRVATMVLAGAANNVQPNLTQTDAYGRDNGLMLFTGLGLFDEARPRLDAAGLDALVAEMLALSRPPVGPVVQQMHARFVNILYVRATGAGLSLPSLQKEAAAMQVTSAWPRAEVLQASFVRAHMGSLDEALRLLQTTLSRDFETRDMMTSAQSNAQFAWRQYQIALGLAGDAQLLGPFGTSGAGVEQLKPLFPVKADAWPGAGAWVAGVARALPLWLEQGAANPDAGIQALSLVALRLHQMGDREGAQTAARHLTAVLRRSPVSLKASTLAMSVGDHVGAAVDLPVLQELTRQGRLDLSRVQLVITRTAAADGAEAALRLGEVAAQSTSNADLLKQLISIAQTAGNAQEAQRWTARQAEADAARAQLKKAPPK
ncbi:MAG: hypothetical protein IPL75_09320 [Acidobacteria bacterium]|nr:hypothetical protein [Acidobacteriota bacterium]